MQASAVGDQTRYGQTMKELLSAEDRLSPLQHKLSVLGGHISDLRLHWRNLHFRRVYVQ